VLALASSAKSSRTGSDFRYAKRYGARSRRWGARHRLLVGAVIGVPVAVIGSVIGAFLGSFIEAALFEYTYSRHVGVASRAVGSRRGPGAAAAAKIAIGMVISSRV